MSSRPSRARSTRSLLISLVVASLLTITVDARSGDGGPLAGIGGALLTVVSPLQHAVAAVFSPIADLVSTIGEFSGIRDENVRLQQEVDDLRRQVATAAANERRLTQLEELLGLQQRLGTGYESIGAQVIASGLSNLEWTVTIDKGSSDGIEAGMPVLASAGVVGLVTSVGLNSAIVRLMLDPSSAVVGRFGADTTGLVSGQGDGDLRMQLVDPAAVVTAGDPVVTAGYEIPGVGGSPYPPGILIGQISRVLPEDSSPERYVTVRPAVDFSALDVVLVVTSNVAR